MERVLEGDHGGTPGCPTSNLDCVFDRFGPCALQHDFLGPVARDNLHQLLAQGDVFGIHHDVEARVQKPVGLVLDGLHHFGVRMPDIQRADAAGKIDEAVTVHIFDFAPTGPCCKYGCPIGHSACHDGITTAFQILAKRPRYGKSVAGHRELQKTRYGTQLRSMHLLCQYLSIIFHA